jgi:hypothetical protein
MTDPDDPSRTTFRLLVVPGIVVDRWTRTWSQRLPEVDLQLVQTEPAHAATLLADTADAGLLRLPVDRDTFHAISLYTEATVVVFPRDHVFAALGATETMTLADLAGETLLRPQDDVLDWTGVPLDPTDCPAGTGPAVELVAAGGGLLVVPMSIARMHHRKDVAHRVVTDAPTSSVALVWPRERYTNLVEEMIGIVRGRTENSTRGRAETPAADRAERPRQTPRRPEARKPGKKPRTPPRRGR